MKGFTRRRGGAEGESGGAGRLRWGLGWRIFDHEWARMGTNGEGMKDEGMGLS